MGWTSNCSVDVILVDTVAHLSAVLFMSLKKCLVRVIYFQMGSMHLSLEARLLLTPKPTYTLSKTITINCNF